MRTSLHRSRAAASCALSVVLLACSGDSPAPPEPCFGCAPAPASGVTGGIVVENRSDHSVTLTMRSFDSLQIDRKVVEGALSVPIGPAMRGPETALTVEPQRTTVLGAGITVVSGKDVKPGTATVVRVGSGPFVIAIGTGVLAVRARDGADLLEAVDPRAVVVLPVEHDGPSCDGVRLGEELDELPAEVASGAPLDVVAFARDERGCRELRAVDDPSNVVRYRACVPDAAFPFSEGAPFAMRALFPPGAVRFTDDAGNELELLPVRFTARESSVVSGITVAFTEETTCASVEDECGAVVVPAKLMLSFDGKTSSALAVGESLVDPRDAAQTIFLTAARSRPVTAPACAKRGDGHAPYRTNGAFAFVKRAR